MNFLYPLQSDAQVLLRRTCAPRKWWPATNRTKCSRPPCVFLSTTSKHQSIPLLLGRSLKICSIYSSNAIRNFAGYGTLANRKHGRFAQGITWNMYVRVFVFLLCVIVESHLLGVYSRIVVRAPIRRLPQPKTVNRYKTVEAPIQAQSPPHSNQELWER